MHEQGRGGATQDDGDEGKWDMIAAEKGDVKSQKKIGQKYTANYLNSCWKTCDSENIKEAIKFYELAVAQGDLGAMYSLGMIYKSGGGGPRGGGEKEIQSCEKAIEWFTRAAESGYRAAEYALGEMYMRGNCVPQNDVEAVKWFRLAAAQGSEIAFYQLKQMYKQGREATKEDAGGAKWYRF